jgi:hypothetical protein
VRTAAHTGGASISASHSGITAPKRSLVRTCSSLCMSEFPHPTRKRWTLRLLAQRLVALEVIESVSYETVRQALKQTASSRG